MAQGDCGDCDTQTARTDGASKTAVKIVDPLKYKTVPCKSWQEKGRCPYALRSKVSVASVRAWCARAPKKERTSNEWL